MLSKVWMPLDEYTTTVLEGLKRGDVNIITPNLEAVWEKLETPKFDLDPVTAFRK